MSRARGFWPVYHPAGLDHELHQVLEELEAGRWLAMRNLLATTGTRWGLRTTRTQVLAAAAARSTVIQEWATEERGSVDATVMLARVKVERALRAHRHQLTGVWQAAQDARAACEAAARVAPADPVRWVCRLALAQLDERQMLEENRDRAQERMLPPCPWELLRQVDQRDRGNREACHRMLQFLYVRAGGSRAEAIDFGRWDQSRTPDGSAILMLPLYTFAESYGYRRQRREDLLGRGEWAADHVLHDITRALDGWFDSPATPLEERSVLDLSHLAHRPVGRPPLRRRGEGVHRDEPVRHAAALVVRQQRRPVAGGLRAGPCPVPVLRPQPPPGRMTALPCRAPPVPLCSRLILSNLRTWRFCRVPRPLPPPPPRSER